MVIINTVFLNAPIYAAQNDIKIILDGKQLVFDESPQIIDGRIFLSMKSIFEALGVIGKWDDKTNTATGKIRKTKIVITVNGSKAYVYNEEVISEVPAKLINNKTMLPVVFIAKSIGIDVNWDGKTKTVTLNSPIPTTVH